MAQILNAGVAMMEVLKGEIVVLVLAFIEIYH